MRHNPIHKYLLASVCYAVVDKVGTGARNPAAQKNIDNIYAQAETRTINSQISITNGDTAASKYDIANVPSNAIIDPTSFYDFAAITGVISFDIGFRFPNKGAVIAANTLVAADDISAAGTQTLRGHGTLTLANSNKRAWELAGLTSDPGGELCLYGTINNNAGASGVVNFTFRFSRAA